MLDPLEGAPPATSPITFEMARIAEAWQPGVVSWGRQPRLGVPRGAGTVSAPAAPSRCASTSRRWCASGGGAPPTITASRSWRTAPTPSAPWSPRLSPRAAARGSRSTSSERSRRGLWSRWGIPQAPGPLLSIRDLSVSFATDGGVLRAVDRVSFDVPAGGTVALVGESGCGKSVTAQAILRLLPAPPARVDGGAILFEGRDLLTLPERAMREVRGGRVGMVFQEPMTSLNPVYTVGFQIMEAIRLHRRVSRGRGAPARHRGPRARRLPRAGAPRRRLRAPALRRDAPARAHRHGAGVQPGAAHRRRAHHRARRHRAGADPRAPPAASATRAG